VHGSFPAIRQHLLGAAPISAERNTRWIVSSEGASLQTSETAYRVLIEAFAKASDGMELPLYESFYSSSPGGVPTDDAVLEKVNKMTKSLMALKTAPVMGLTSARRFSRLEPRA
jgi:TldD protein